MRRLLLALALLLGLAAPAAAQSRQDVAPFAGPGTPVVIGQGYDLPTKHYPKPRRINVQLPPGYDDPKNRDRRYPVLYLLDGGAGWQDFAHIAGIVQQGGTWGISAPVILVGVESGDRKAEFTQPSSDPGEQQDFPTHGKAETFRQFLVQDLKPAIDAAWRTDGTDGLIGESLAALFVVDEFLSIRPTSTVTSPSAPASGGTGRPWRNRRKPNSPPRTNRPAPCGSPSPTRAEPCSPVSIWWSPR